jgi:uncharacterized protein YndB with AHSA1/START domain
MATASNAVLAGDREILMTRVFRAPRELVWRAWTDPEHLGQWWGPRGFATHTQHMEVRPGGRWRYVMRGPDGREYHNQVTYLEVTPPERIRFQHGGGEATEPVSHDMLATFEASGRNGLSTLVTLRMTFATPEARDHAVHMYGALEGGHQTFERLAEYLTADSAPSQQASDHLLRYRRVLSAPLALLWSAWTEPEQLKRWYGPAGGTISECTMELRPGGLFHYGLRTPDHAQMWGRWQFREIVPQARLVFVAACSDAARGVTRQPDKADWPLQMLASVSFAEHAGIGRGTLVDTEWQPLEPSPAERAAFAAGHGTMEQCCSRTFDQLQGYLAGRARPA